MQYLTLLLAFILFSTPVMAAAPDIGDNSLFVCVERRNESSGECTGQIQWVQNHKGKSRKGKRVRFKRARVATNKAIRYFTRQKRKAENAGNAVLAAELDGKLTNANTTKTDLATCRDYSASCGATSTQPANSCTIAGNPAGTGVLFRVRPKRRNSRLLSGFKFIVNGASCSAQTNSPVVALVDSQGRFCTGSLVADDVVLTAAHCVENGCSGVSVETEGGTSRAVSSCVIHPEYQSRRSRDVAILDLASAFPGTVNLVMINADSSKISVGDTTVFAGYGRNEVDDTGLRATSNILSAITKKGYLATKYKRGDYNTGTTCNGDSGGPLLTFVDGEWQIQGVLSFGTANNCALPNTKKPKDISFWADLNVASTIQFIKDNTTGLIP